MAEKLLNWRKTIIAHYKVPLNLACNFLCYSS